MPPTVTNVDATLLITLSLVGTFVFGLSGGMAAVRARLDIFGVAVLAGVVGIAGGTSRELLIASHRKPSVATGATSQPPGPPAS